MGLVLINYHGLMLGKYEEMNAKGFTIYRVELLCMCVVQKKNYYACVENCMSVTFSRSVKTTREQSQSK